MKINYFLFGIGALSAVGVELILLPLSPPVQASEKILQRAESYYITPNVLEQSQVTSVSEFVDVKPTDWAFQALQSLVERYGCIAGYPTEPPLYQGKKVLSRYEFAAGLNACLDRINELIGSATESLITQDDLLVLRKLQDEFSSELGLLRGRLDTLEARAITLEQQQFSPTTKLRGEIIFAPYGVSDGDAAYNRVELAQLSRNFTGVGNVPGVVTPVAPGSPARGMKQNRQSSLALGYRVRLNFLGSFSGKDLLQVRLEAADVANLATATGSFASRLGYETTTGGNVVIDDLWYRFPFAQGRGEIQIAGASNEFVDFFDTYSIFAPSGTGSISRFGRSNALFYRSGGHNGTGAFIRYRFTPQFVVSGAYIATNPSGGVLGSANGAANPDLGLFGSNYTGAVILGFEPLTNFRFGLAYSHAYNENITTPTTGTTAQGINLFGGVGTSFANAPFGSGTGTRLAVNLDTINLNFQWRSSPQFILSGWFGYGIVRGETDALPSLDPLGSSRQANIMTAALQFGFPDPWGRSGDLAGFIVGIPPYVSASQFQTVVAPGDGNAGVKLANRDVNVPIHLELMYRFQVNKYVQVTPGAFVVLNPEGNSDNSAIFVYTIRTIFNF
ncbi:carbohydrate-selective porin OprB [Gloeomargarita lithophora Alchichica-D10]|uniref:Carbohydrate-selective porin OprB n=1 Tax=Gloeomargarita lithophora Alchichica-D10 TaxID=1188229 RepID=A0A1J0ADS9_9CYAN|nr:iron uptake porin [Gloeomargarita lithophora]APB34081.1 carbohydrate-selective porin OprB [Gloeomargarita lithophora Alchichica-D10]